MSQHRCTGSWTDEAMDDADAIYTTTTTTHAHGLATPSSSTTSTTSTTTKLPRHRLGPASSLLQASSIYHDYHAVQDRRGRTTRAGAAGALAALHRLMDTDEAMDDADAHLYTTTIIMHGEWEAKTEDNDYSLIGDTPAS